MKFTQILTISCLTTLLACPIVSSAYALPAGSDSATTRVSATVSISVDGATWMLPSTRYVGTRIEYSADYPGMLLTRPALVALFVRLVSYAAIPTSSVQAASNSVTFSDDGASDVGIDLSGLGFISTGASQYSVSVPTINVPSLSSFISRLSSSDIEVMNSWGVRLAWPYNGKQVSTTLTSFTGTWANQPGTSLTLLFDV